MDSTPIVLRHHALQRLLRRVHVVVPFGRALASRVPFDRPEARRAFPHALQVIMTIALLHQRQRAHGPLQHGDTIEATIDDYRIARRLLAGPMSRAIGGALTNAAAKLGERLRQAYGTDIFNTTQALQDDKIIKSRGKMSEYLTTLLTAGVVELVELGRGNKPSKWQVVGDPPTAEATWLPEADALEGSA